MNIRGNAFNKSSEDDNSMIERYLQDLPVDCMLLDNMDMSDCELTDDTFVPIAGVLKFVKHIQLSSNELTIKSLCRIFKVCTYIFIYIFIYL